jgi:hypothetical protein
MKRLSTYVHAHATVQLDESERFVAHDDGLDVEIFEVRWSGERYEGTGRVLLARGRRGEPDVVQLRAQDIPLPVRRQLAADRLEAARETLHQAHLDAETLNAAGGPL